MIDIDKQVAYWRDVADEDWVVACSLIRQQHTRHGLFFAHLALEKAIKAHVCRVTRDLAPRTHNLVRLAEVASLRMSDEQIDVLAEFNAFSLEGRYPEQLSAPPTAAEAMDGLERAEPVYAWLMQQL